MATHKRLDLDHITGWDWRVCIHNGDMWVIPSILMLPWVSATTFRRLLVAVIGI